MTSKNNGGREPQGRNLDRREVPGEETPYLKVRFEKLHALTVLEVEKSNRRRKVTYDNHYHRLFTISRRIVKSLNEQDLLEAFHEEPMILKGFFDRHGKKITKETSDVLRQGNPWRREALEWIRDSLDSYVFHAGLEHVWTLDSKDTGMDASDEAFQEKLSKDLDRQADQALAGKALRSSKDD